MENTATIQNTTTAHNVNDIYSEAEKENLLRISQEFEREFPVGSVFPTRRHLVDAMRQNASRLGFFLVDRGFALLCSETTARESENSRRKKSREELAGANGKVYVPRKVGKSKCGCEFKAAFSPMRGSTTPQVKITKVQYMHGKGCKPSAEQFKAAWRSGGHASKHIEKSKNSKLHTIVQLLASAQPPSAKTMRAMLQDMLPKDFDVSSKFINNVKTKIRAKISNGDFDVLLSQGTLSSEETDFILHTDSLDDDSICSTSQERMDCMGLNSQKKKQSVVTYRDFTAVANSVANLALSLPSEESRRECLGVLVHMRDTLSMSAATGLQPSVPLLGFAASAEKYLSAIGPNAESRREGVFQPLANPAHLEIQRHNIDKVRHERLASFSKRNVQKTRSRRLPLSQLSENLHLKKVVATGLPSVPIADPASIP